MNETEIENLSLPERCARFEYCSANKCPLDPLMNKRNAEPDDPTCDMSKSRRHNYWAQMSPAEQALLPYEGYFEGEFNRKRAWAAKWNSLSQKEKDATLEKLAQLRLRRRKLAADPPQSTNSTTQEATPPAAYGTGGNSSKQGLDPLNEPRSLKNKPNSTPKTAQYAHTSPSDGIKPPPQPPATPDTTKT